MFASILAVSLGLQKDVDLALDRFQAYMKSARTFSTDYSVKLADAAYVGTGSVVWQRPGLQRFTCKWHTENFEFRQNPGLAITIDHRQLQYVLDRDQTGIVEPPSIFNALPNFGYPVVLLLGDLRKISGRVQWKIGPKLKESSMATHLVASLGPDQKVEAAVDPQGKLLMYHLREQRPDGLIDVTFKFSNTDTNKPVNPQVFHISEPTGYVPHYYDLPLAPLPIGSKAPESGWINAKTGEAATLDKVTAGEPTLVIVTDPNCHVSQRAEALHRNLDQLMKSKKGRAIQLVLGRTAPSQKEWPTYLDRTGELEKKLQVPGTPMYFLLSGSGEVLYLWIGFDPETGEPLAGLNKALADPSRK